MVAGPEFGPELQGMKMIVCKALYGLQSSSARFHEHLSVKLRKLNFKPSKADPDLWMRKNKDGSKMDLASSNDFCSSLRYVDDVL